MTMPAFSPTARESERVVQAQLDAYNARDLDAWLATYREDAEQFMLHAGSLAKGHGAIRQRMEERFKDPKLHATLLHRTVMESTVVDHERVTRTTPDGLAEVEMICIYEVSGGKIVKATFAIGPMRDKGPA
jgi:hypothetical protein